jgi:hypothetical protein
MKTRHIPFAVLTITILTAASGFALTTAQDSTAKPAPSAPPAETVQLSAGVWEILRLTRAKIADDVTVSFIQNGSRRYNLSASEIIYLRKEGVSDRVLVAMLNQPARPAPTSPIAPQAAAPAYVPSASAPEYVQGYTQPAPVYESAPASTVYVFPESSRYYYSSYPYYYGYSYPYYGYSYPYYRNCYPSWSVGVSFGSGYYGGWWGGSAYCGSGYRGGYYYPYYGKGYCGNSYVTGPYHRGGYRGGYHGGNWSTAGQRAVATGNRVVANHQISSPTFRSSPNPVGNPGSRIQNISAMRVNSAPASFRGGSGFSGGARPGIAPSGGLRGSSIASVGRASGPRMAAGGGAIRGGGRSR